MAFDIDKLEQVIEIDRREMEYHRRTIEKFVEEFAGSHYSREFPENPVNMISLFVRIVTNHIVGGQPQMLASTEDKQIKKWARTFQEWTNLYLQKIKFGSILERAFVDSLFFMGIVRCAITAPAETRFSGRAQGMPTHCNIDFEDFLCDTSVKEFHECAYIGHEYVANIEMVHKMKSWSRRRKEIEPDIPGYSLEAEDRLSIFTDNHRKMYEDRVTLREIYFPREGKVITIPKRNRSKIILAEQDFIGPACGPYLFLYHQRVPGNLFPKSPIMDIFDNHREHNALWKKLCVQASKAKRVVAFQDLNDAANIEKARDGQFVQSQGQIQEVQVSSGPQQAVMVFNDAIRETISRNGGNWDALGGLGAQADTATQEKMITETANVLVKHMSVRTTTFAQDCLRSLAWYVWNHPEITMKSMYSPPQVPDIKIERKVTPMDRYGTDFDLLKINIDPYTLVNHTPGTKLAVIRHIMNNVIMPSLAFFGQPGVGDLLAAYINMEAEMTNVPEIKDLLEKLIGVQTPTDEPTGVPEGPPMPNQSERTYRRVSTSEMSAEGNRQVIAQQMAGLQGDTLGQMR